MKIPGPLVLLGYVVDCGLGIRELTGWRKENSVGVYLLCTAFLLGWFFVISYLVEREKKRQEKSLLARTFKTGGGILGSWLLYMFGLLVIGGVGSFLLL